MAFVNQTNCERYKTCSGTAPQRVTNVYFALIKPAEPLKRDGGGVCLWRESGLETEYEDVVEFTFALKSLTSRDRKSMLLISDRMKSLQEKKNNTVKHLKINL